MQVWQLNEIWRTISVQTFGMKENSKMHTASPTHLHTQSPSPRLTPPGSLCHDTQLCLPGLQPHSAPCCLFTTQACSSSWNPPTNLSSAPFSHCSNTLSMRPAHTLDLNRNLPLHGTVVPSVPPFLLSECY